MKGNDLSSAPTPRYWTTAEVVFTADTTVSTKRVGLFGKAKFERVTYTPDLRTLSMLWQWSNRMGCRMELIFVSDLAEDAKRLWESLDGAANPFSEYFVFGDINDAVNMLPYRPDLLGVIDQPGRFVMWGGKGLTTESLH